MKRIWTFLKVVLKNFKDGLNPYNPYITSIIKDMDGLDKSFMLWTP